MSQSWLPSRRVRVAATSNPSRQRVQIRLRSPQGQTSPSALASESIALAFVPARLQSKSTTTAMMMATRISRPVPSPLLDHRNESTGLEFRGSQTRFNARTRQRRSSSVTLSLQPSYLAFLARNPRFKVNLSMRKVLDVSHEYTPPSASGTSGSPTSQGPRRRLGCPWSAPSMWHPRSRPHRLC